MTDVRATSSVRSDLVVAVVLTAVCLVLYVATLTPGLAFPVMDGHELTVNATRLGVVHPSGYPLYTWVAFLAARLLPIGEVAYRLNLLSACSAAASVGLLHLLGRRLGLDRIVAIAGALVLAVSTTFWSQAVITEVYAPDVVMVALTLWLLLRWADGVRAGVDADRRFVTFAFVYGLSLGTHLSNLAFAPAFTVFVLLVAPRVLGRPRLLLLAFAAFALAAAQYLWLPLRGARYDQYPNLAPVTWVGFYAYTAGAFASQRFAYPLVALPFRLVFYLEQLRDNVGLLGIALGTVGMWAALRADPTRFWLLAGVYLTNVVLFAQFDVPDVTVFFVPGYVVWALFMGFGLQAAIDLTRAGWLGGGTGRVVRAGAMAALAVWLVASARTSLLANDRRSDTLVGDFGRNVYDMLPEDSVVLAARGAFGADMLYWQVAERLRPDVVVAGQRGARPRAPADPYFVTVRTADGQPTAHGRRGHPAEAFPAGAWYVPVLFGNAYALTLTRVDATPPTLFAAGETPPSRIDRRVADVTLLDAVVASRPAAPRPRLSVESWWRMAQVARVVVSTRVDDVTLESHQLGLGNLLRLAAEAGAPRDPVVRESYDVVLPSTLPAGRHVVRLGVTDFGTDGFRMHWIDVGDVVVE